MTNQRSHVFTDNFSTTDPHQAAFILAFGHEVRAVEGTGWRRFVFDAEAADAAAAYHDDAPVPALRFVRAQRDIRALLHHSV
jgi:hypothetical protein